MKALIFSLLLSAPLCARQPTPPASNPDPATALLITSPELADSWKPFADWKTSRGKPTEIITTARIAADFDAPDIQEKIRLCVRQHIDTRNTRWIILGGDSQPGGKGIVPDRDTVHKTMWGENKHIPTDIYYLSPTNWDADADGIHGEHKDDRDAITYPDGSVALGRIPVRTRADIAAYTDKVIAYESRYPKGGFANTMVYTCTVAGAYPKVRRSWDGYVSKALVGGTMDRYFADKTPWDQNLPGDYDLTPDHWIELINSKRVGKFHFHGHGLINGWVLENNRMFTAKHVARLTNEDAYPVITTVSCFTGHFDAEKDPCIVESMLRRKKAGAIAIVAPCREGKPHFLNPKQDFRLMVSEGKLDGTTLTMTRFWTHGLTDKLSTGHALMTTKAGMAADARKSPEFHLCLSELNLLGDPTLDFLP